MTDPKRLESGSGAEAAHRDSQIEALLVDGLDHYFNNRLEEAIHLWTRVLFLDRSHARARAYIDRARSALGERQRRAEELLQTSHDLLAQGRTDAARDLLSEAVATSGDDERAAALRVRLERLERVQSASGRSQPAASPMAVPGWTWPARSPLVFGVGLTLVAGLLLVGVVGSPVIQTWLGLPSGAEQLVVTAGPTDLTVLSSADVALVRAETLYGRGRLAEALRTLDRVPADSPVRARADELRIEIQRLLLASGSDMPGPAGPAEGIRR
jgi:tetratricopeptide (TPR) repeat protein